MKLPKLNPTKRDAAQERRDREYEIAIAKIAELQSQRLYGSATFHFQAGAIVRVIVETSEKIGA